ncbi:uncharacterized protein LOC128883249 isoform X2 [Hylaeus volcanicus]|uniref:uncharacterized protein LOC128883249 isoform X2 n=1 Tax=Hylaeus volcanicus TaxID=313075 RepID=UPI0023B82EB5|nr:uncharacterized protein LOC128883249 isoform X2 [Hylaeus volcanicus]
MELLFSSHGKHKCESIFSKKRENRETVVIFDSTFRAYCETLCDRNLKLLSGNEKEKKLLVLNHTKSSSHQFDNSVIYIDETLYELSPLQCHKMLNAWTLHETSISESLSTTFFFSKFLKYLFQSLHENCLFVLFSHHYSVSFPHDIRSYISSLNINLTQVRKKNDCSSCHFLNVCCSFLFSPISWYQSRTILKNIEDEIDTNFDLKQVKTMQLIFYRKHYSFGQKQKRQTSQNRIKKLEQTRDSIREYFQHQISECSSNSFVVLKSLKTLHSMDTQESYYEELNGTYTNLERTPHCQKMFLVPKTTASPSPCIVEPHKSEHIANSVVQLPSRKDQVLKLKCSYSKKLPLTRRKSEKRFTIYLFLKQSCSVSTSQTHLFKKLILPLMKCALVTGSDIFLKKQKHLNQFVFLKHLIFFSKLLQIRISSKRNQNCSSLFLSRVLSNLLSCAFLNSHFFRFKQLSLKSYLKLFINLIWTNRVSLSSPRIDSKRLEAFALKHYHSLHKRMDKMRELSNYFVRRVENLCNLKSFEIFEKLLRRCDHTNSYFTLDPYIYFVVFFSCWFNIQRQRHRMCCPINTRLARPASTLERLEEISDDYESVDSFTSFNDYKSVQSLGSYHSCSSRSSTRSFSPTLVSM